MRDETLFPVSAAIERAIGLRLHTSTWQRWRLRGVAGVRLDTVRIGGRRMTSVEAVRRFIDASTSAVDGKPIKPVACANRVRENAIRRAEDELTRAGI